MEALRQAYGPQLRRGPVGPFLEHDERGGGIRLIDGGDGVVAVEDQDVANAMELTGDLADALSNPARCSGANSKEDRTGWSQQSIVRAD